MALAGKARRRGARIFFKPLNRFDYASPRKAANGHGVPKADDSGLDSRGKPALGGIDGGVDRRLLRLPFD